MFHGVLGALGPIFEFFKDQLTLGGFTGEAGGWVEPFLVELHSPRPFEGLGGFEGRKIAALACSRGGGFAEDDEHRTIRIELKGDAGAAGFDFELRQVALLACHRIPQLGLAAGLAEGGGDFLGAILAVREEVDFRLGRRATRPFGRSDFLRIRGESWQLSVPSLRSRPACLASNRSASHSLARS